MSSGSKTTDCICLSLIGFCVGIVLHSLIIEFLWLGFIFLIPVPFLLGAWLLFYTEYSPQSDSRAEQVKAMQANFNQSLALLVVFGYLLGGLVAWVG